MPVINSHFLSFCKSLNIEYHPIQPLWPRGNPIAERFMKNLNKVIRCLEVAGTNWRTDVASYINIYRATPHSTTGFTPNVVMGISHEIRVPYLQNTMPQKQLQAQLVKTDTRNKA